MLPFPKIFICLICSKDCTFLMLFTEGLQSGQCPFMVSGNHFSIICFPDSLQRGKEGKL